MKFTTKLGLSIMFIGTGLVGTSLKDHSNGHYIGSGAMLGLGLGMLGSMLSKKPKIEINAPDDSDDDD